MKTCSTCGEPKSLEDFNRRASAPDGRQPRCRSCCREWYVKHRVAHIAAAQTRVRRVRLENQVHLADYFAENPCVDCGEADIRVLEFDHRPGVLKIAEVTRMAVCGLNWNTIMTEIAKCDVRCANCHRRRTAERGRWWKQAVFAARRGQDEQGVTRRLSTLFPATLS